MVEFEALKPLAARLHALREKTAEGPARDVWRDCVVAFADAAVPVMYHAHFVQSCENGSPFPIRGVS